MKKLCAHLSFAVMILTGCTTAYEWNTDNFTVRMDPTANISGLVDLSSGVNYLAHEIPASLLSLRIDGELVYPVSAQFSATDSSISLRFPDDRKAKVSVGAFPTHIRFELVDVEPTDGVELVVWGPYPTVLNEVIGETVGIVQGTDFAIGIQALNPKTLGGFPWNENDALPQLDIFEGDDFSDLNPAGKRGVLYRVEAAKPDSFGSTLQAYTRQRDSERVIANRGYDFYVAPTYDDGGIIGSSIALFGSPVGEILETIGKIEIAEGLPHPMIDGEWGKISESASAAYIILGFGENDFERALDVTRQAGLRYLYHPDPFENWGHFQLKKSYFPGGTNSLRNMVEHAGDEGIMLGVHMLSNFITPNDPYVSPNPDPRLARVGTSRLSEAIDAEVETIPIESPQFFNQAQQSFLRASVIDDEIIQCQGISDSEPWHLLDCARGAFGTTATSHEADAAIGKLDDHAYNVFLSTAGLSIEMAQNVAALFNETGLRQISFDGLEGNRSTAMGNYGEILFTQSWFDALDDTIRSHYIADASRTSHFFWHMYTRMNWGEPWYAGFRESQTEYRLKNQAYFQRNLMPGMLGWFSMQAETSIEDIEWMLARSAGFNAGYGFVTGYDRLDANGHSDLILELLGRWEAARMAGAFSEGQKSAMQDIANEFHLEPVDEGSWDLSAIRSLKLNHQSHERQPGEPTHSTLQFSSQPGERVELILSAVGADVSGIELEIDGKPVFTRPTSILAGRHLKYDGSESAVLYTSTWHVAGNIPLEQDGFSLTTGEHSLAVRADMGADSASQLKLELRLVGVPERIQAR